MMSLHQPWPYLATAVLLALMSLYAWRQPRRPGARFFIWILAAWLAMALAGAVYAGAHTTQTRYLAWVVQTALALLTSLLDLLISLEFIDDEKWLARRSRVWLAIPTLIFALMVIAFPPRALTTIELHGGYEIIRANDYISGGLLTYHGLLILGSLGILLSCLLRSPVYVAPLGLIAIGQAFPRIAFFLVDPHQSAVPPLQIMVLCTSLSALAYLLALYNDKLLRVPPVARDKVISHMPYAMFVVDGENLLVDFNPAAQELPDLPGKLALRQAADQALGRWWDRISPLIGAEAIARDVEVRTEHGAEVFQISALPLHQSNGWKIGQAFVVANVTNERLAQQNVVQKLSALASLQEREQLANELHDGLSQNLAYLSMQAQVTQVYLETGQHDTAEANLSRLIEAAGQIQDETRELIGNLLSVSLPSENFVSAIRQILNNFEQQTGLPVRVSMCEDTDFFFSPNRLPPTVTVQLVRIVQEALANIRKHARARQVALEIMIIEGQLMITITDDGAGFDPAVPVTEGKHYGSQIMHQRAARIGGRVTVSSSPGAGTCIAILTPLANYSTRSSE